jgi:hypothetical protein
MALQEGGSRQSTLPACCRNAANLGFSIVCKMRRPIG